MFVSLLPSKTLEYITRKTLYFYNSHRQPGNQSTARDVQMAIDPEALDAMDQGALGQLYQAQVDAQGGASQRQDLSDMVAARAAAQKRKI